VLLVVGVLGAARVVRGRGRRLAWAAALFGVMGALGHVAYATFSLLTIRIVDAAPDRGAAIETLEAINNDAAIGLLVMPLIVAYGFSVLLLPLAFHRRHLVPLWVMGVAGMAFREVCPWSPAPSTHSRQPPRSPLPGALRSSPPRNGAIRRPSARSDRHGPLQVQGTLLPGRQVPIGRSNRAP
jgi:hypothetical protein